MKALDELRLEAHTAKKDMDSSVPSHVLTRMQFEDTTLADLMHCIITWLAIHSHNVYRLDIRHKPGGAGKPAKSTIKITDDGSHMLAIINKKTVFITLSTKQHPTQSQLQFKKRTEAGGAYFWIIKSFEQFLTEYKQLITEYK